MQPRLDRTRRPCRTARPLACLGLVAFFTGIGWGMLWLGGHWPPQAWQLAATGTMGLGAGIGSYIAVVMPSDWQRRR